MTRPLPDPHPRAEKCAALGHPGATYNAALDRTWCLCGAATYDGDRDTGVTRNGGPLDRHRPSTAGSGVAAAIGDILGAS